MIIDLNMLASISSMTFSSQINSYDLIAIFLWRTKIHQIKPTIPVRKSSSFLEISTFLLPSAYQNTSNHNKYSICLPQSMASYENTQIGSYGPTIAFDSLILSSFGSHGSMTVLQNHRNSPALLISR